MDCAFRRGNQSCTNCGKCAELCYAKNDSVGPSLDLAIVDITGKKTADKDTDERRERSDQFLGMLEN